VRSMRRERLRGQGWGKTLKNELFFSGTHPHVIVNHYVAVSCDFGLVAIALKVSVPLAFQSNLVGHIVAPRAGESSN